ncbi:MAG: ketol-acid reductoisomerase [Candidatus Marinimicrobia bacterium]|nr:ketol-acid reductoisomerase [Candidatus Neomarinimicrobiota bacterium]
MIEIPTIFKDVDVKKNLLIKKKVGIIGYGNQGRAQALNLRDSKITIKIGLRKNSKSADLVVKDGLDFLEIPNLVKWADVIAILIPDEIMSNVYEDHIKPHLNKNQLLLFSHGFNIHYKHILTPEYVDVVLVAPSGPGKMVREKYEIGKGIPNLLAIHNDYSSQAFDIMLSYSYNIGGTKIGAIKSSFKEECETDLFGEQVVLCGGIPKLIKMAFNTLVKSGYQPVVAWFVCFYEVKLIVDLFFEKGFDYMNESISDTAEFGGYKVGDIIFDKELNDRMKNILQDIQSGNFNKEWSKESKMGYKELMKMRLADRNSLIEKTTQFIIKKLN